MCLFLAASYLKILKKYLYDINIKNSLVIETILHGILVALQMEFVLYAQAFLNSYSCRNDWKRKNRWEKPDSDEKHSQWKVSFFINTLFNSDEKEDDSIGSSQEEVSCCVLNIILE